MSDRGCYNSPLRRRRHVRSLSISPSRRRRSYVWRRSPVEVSPLRSSVLVGTTHRPPPALPPHTQPSHTVTSAMLEEDVYSRHSSPPPASSSHRDVILDAWNVIMRRAQGFEQQVTDFSFFPECASCLCRSVFLYFLPALWLYYESPDGFVHRCSTDTCCFRRSFGSCSTLSQNFKMYAPSSGPVVFVSVRPSTAPQLCASFRKFEFSLAQFLDSSLPRETVCWLPRILFSFSSVHLESWDELAMADVQCLSSALRLVSRD